MIQHIIPPLFLLAIYLYALSEAWRDANDIRIGHHIDHVEGLLRRCFMGLLLLGVVMCFSFLFLGIHTRSLNPLAISAAALFSLRFRLRLNHLRGHNWTYMAPWSNVYDNIFWTVACVVTRRWYMRKAWGLAKDGDLIGKWFRMQATGQPIGESVSPPIKLAPRLASIFETTLLALSWGWTHWLIR